MTRELSFHMPPPSKTLIPPPKGWKEQTYYVVDIAVSKSNPIHRAILYVGFLNGPKDQPLRGGYTSLLRAMYDEVFDPNRLHYLRVVSEITDMARAPEEPPEPHPMGHVLFTDADPDRPMQACDRNGSIALGVCKKCGRVEVELDEPCGPRTT